MTAVQRLTSPERRLAEVTAERDRLHKALAFVLGEFDQDRNEYTGAVLNLWQGSLTAEEMTSAREALGGGTDG